MRTLMIATAACGLAACAAEAPESQQADAALAAFQNARMHECPAERMQADAHASGEAESAGTEIEDVAIVAAAGEPARALRLRRVTVAPGGTIGWHDHAAVQGMALVLAGELIETRNTCLDQMTYTPGDIAREDAETAHSWRNEGDAPAVILVAHVIAG